MTRYLHTMVRITDPERSRAFYEALGLEFRREMDIVRNGEKEATNYFFGVEGQDEELELTFNHDGRTYELGTAYGHVAYSVDDLAATLAALGRAGHRGGTRAVPRPRRRLADLLRPGSRRLPHRADRPQREVARRWTSPGQSASRTSGTRRGTRTTSTRSSDHYADDVEMTSPLVSALTGRDEDRIVGKDALRAYFAAGLERFPTLHFEPIGLFVGVDSLVLHYRRTGGNATAELVILDDEDKVVRYYAITPSRRSGAMRALLTCRPLAGHYRPMLPLARALAEAGHDVRVRVGRARRRRSGGGRVHGVSCRAGLGLRGAGRMPAHSRACRHASCFAHVRPLLFTELFVRVELEPRANDLFAIVEQWAPHVVVHDVAEFAAPLVATVGRHPVCGAQLRTCDTERRHPCRRRRRRAASGPRTA